METHQNKQFPAVARLVTVLYINIVLLITAVDNFNLKKRDFKDTESY